MDMTAEVNWFSNEPTPPKRMQPPDPSQCVCTTVLLFTWSLTSTPHPLYCRGSQGVTCEKERSECVPVPRSERVLYCTSCTSPSTATTQHELQSWQWIVERLPGGQHISSTSTSGPL